jgi:hypothetical protein
LRKIRERNRVVEEAAEEAEWRKTHRRNHSVPAREDQERNSGRIALAVPSNNPTFLARPVLGKPCRRKKTA